MAAIGKHGMLGQLRRPAVIALGKGLFNQDQDGIHPANGIDIERCSLSAGQCVQMGGHAVIPAEIALIDGAGIVAQRAVIPPHRVGGGQRRRPFQRFGDLLRA